ncbi:DUF3306 domain-containing protein [Roseibium sp. MMSF_3412]|uniref:DUF3306 domain-containing protein n=1 Tax=Roseibium sp. MMSF_3412 TaxID=3046712 RepID=UPI00273CF6F7|nr:DUF3306 domain-containing protein [Roseibium sp. MMSF_3412]
MSGGSQDETGGDFWSRRKAAVRQAEEAEQAQEQAALAAEERAALEEKSDEDILEELGLPDPETLTKEDDFSGFLSAAVPERIRRRALRKLWGLNPVLANLDGLVDYAEDYTDAATVVENLQTVYKIGKGMLEQFADVDDETEQTPELKPENLSEKEEISEEDKVLEENVAAHNDYVENEETPVQLTQADNVAQSQEKHEIQVDPQESEAEKVEFDFQVTRRRLRFDYS